MDLGQESSAPDVSSTDPLASDSDSGPPAPKKKRKGESQGEIVKRIRDANRRSEDDDRSDGSSMMDKGIMKFKAKRVLTPGAQIRPTTSSSSSNSRPNTSDYEGTLEILDDE